MRTAPLVASLLILGTLLAWIWSGPNPSLHDTDLSQAESGAVKEAELDEERATPPPRARSQVGPDDADVSPALERPIVQPIEGVQTTHITLLEASSGLPVPELTLEVHYCSVAAGRIQNAPSKEWIEVTSDQAGRLPLEVSDLGEIVELRPSKNGSQARSVEPAFLWVHPDQEASARVDCTSPQLSIQVLGQTRLPVENAIVHLSRHGEARTENYLVQKTDEFGALSLPWPPAGGSTEGWRASAQHFQEGASAPASIPNDPSSQRIEIELEAGHRFDLRVQDLAGNAFPNLEVRLRGMQLSQQRFVAQLMAEPSFLNWNGEYSWAHLPNGNYELSLRSPISIGWLDREIQIDGTARKLVWTIDQEPNEIALAGHLATGPAAPWESPIQNHYVELIDAQSRELIAGTRTDGAGRFQLFGAASGEVILLTNELESDYTFGVSEHRFMAGTQDVELFGTKKLRLWVTSRIVDADSGQAIANASLRRADTQLEALVARTNPQGILRAQVQHGLSYVLEAEGYQPLTLTIELNSFAAVLTLDPVR